MNDYNISMISPQLNVVIFRDILHTCNSVRWCLREFMKSFYFSTNAIKCVHEFGVNPNWIQFEPNLVRSENSRVNFNSKTYIPLSSAEPTKNPVA